MIDQYFLGTISGSQRYSIDIKRHQSCFFIIGRDWPHATTQEIRVFVVGFPPAHDDPVTLLGSRSKKSRTIIFDNCAGS